jgi:hypothetical protein
MATMANSTAAAPSRVRLDRRRRDFDDVHRAMASDQGAVGAVVVEDDRVLAEQDAPQVISVACAPRQTRTEPVEPPVTTTSR